MTRLLAVARSIVTVTVLAAAILGLGFDLVQTAYNATEAAQSVLATG